MNWILQGRSETVLFNFHMMELYSVIREKNTIHSSIKIQWECKV